MGKSLEEVHESVKTQNHKNKFRKIFSFLGPAYMISVGYMDPGNWATDLAGGSQFGYALIWVLLMSNLMALLLQSLSARMGIVAQKDLAQASRESYGKWVNYVLYFLAEIAIAACDLAEVLGMAIGLNLLFGISLLEGVLITVLDTFLLLFLINKGIRKMEAFIITLVAIIGFSFVFEMFFAQPDMTEMAKGLIPTLPNSAALYIAIGIIGATVMPHNLYLHSSLVQTRKFDRSPKGIKQALKFNFIDSTIALNLAFFVNAAILILAAATFHKNGMFEIAEIQDAHRLLQPVLGTKWAPILFAVALIAAGQSSTITGTLAGQIIMEGYLQLRIQPWVRRIMTRLIAIVPAVLVIWFFGESVTGKLLVFSQVILSLQLGFAIIPLIHFVSNKQKMNGFQIGRITQITAWIIASIIIFLNAKLVFDQITEWLASSENPMVLWLTVVPLSVGFLLLLLYIIFQPFFFIKNQKNTTSVEANWLPTSTSKPTNIAIAIDFSNVDNQAINHAIQLGGKEANYTLIHVIQSVNAHFYGQQAHDTETDINQKLLQKYQSQLQENGYNIHIKIGYGKPTKALANIINQSHFDLLVMGAHGHKTLKDILFGTTINDLRHQINIPLYLIK